MHRSVSPDPSVGWSGPSFISELLDTVLADYAAALGALRADNIDRLRRFLAAEVHFRDPFNDVRGIGPMLRVLEKMFADADDVRFQVIDVLRREERGMIRWHFSCRPRLSFVRAPWTIDGVSEVIFGSEGRIAEHIDYWDAGSDFYGRLPLLGRVIRRIRRYAAANKIVAPEISRMHHHAARQAAGRYRPLHQPA